MNDIIEKSIIPLVDLFFPKSSDKITKENHSFIVRYKIGEDTDLTEHVDDSEITLNVCLGRQFTGGSIYFRGIKGTPGANELYHEYEHKVGTAILHVGKHLHGANKITSGDRSNLIVWCKGKNNVSSIVE